MSTREFQQALSGIRTVSRSVPAIMACTADGAVFWLRTEVPDSFRACCLIQRLPAMSNYSTAKDPIPKQRSRQQWRRRITGLVISEVARPACRQFKLAPGCGVGPTTPFLNRKSRKQRRCGFERPGRSAIFRRLRHTNVIETTKRSSFGVLVSTHLRCRLSVQAQGKAIPSTRHLATANPV